MISEYINNSLYCLMPSGRPNANDSVTLFIHGFGGSSRHWLPLVKEPYLGRNNCIPLLFDLEGHGESRGKVPSDINPYSNDISAIIKKFQLSKISIVAHSLGGLIAQDFCLKNPGIVNKLILLSTAPNVMLHPDLLQQLKSKCIDEDFLFACMNSGVSQYAKKVVAGDFHHLNIEEIPPDFLGLSKINFLDKLHCISSDTMVLFGDSDKVISPRRMRLLKSKIPNANEIVLKNVGHYPHLEATSIVAEIIAAFLLTK